MLQLHRFLVNPLDSPEISLAELIAFTTDNIERMTANDPHGDLSDRVAATTAALGGVMDSAADDQVQLGIRKGVKFAKDHFRAQLADRVRPIYGAVLGAFNDPSQEMNQVFPSGRRVLNTARDDQLLTHLQTMETAVIALQATLGPAVVAKATALRSEWESIHAASEKASGDKTATEAERRQARSDLQLELYLTLAKMMTLFPRQPEMLGLYMRQQLLDGTPTPTPGPSAGGGSGGGGQSGGGSGGGSSSSSPEPSSSSSLSSTSSPPSSSSPSSSSPSSSSPSPPVYPSSSSSLSSESSSSSGSSSSSPPA